MKRAGLYIRVSTEEQALHGHSIKAQTDKLKSYCKAMGYDIAKLYIDQGVSGGIPLNKRKAGQDLANDINKNKIDTIIAYSLSRLFRDVVDGLTNIRLWDKKGISVVLMDVGGSCLDTSSAMGKMMISVLLACNELERNITGERVALVHSNKKANKKVWTKSVYGFDRQGDDLIPNDKEQSIIQRIRNYRENGTSYQKIATILNDENIPTKERKTWYPVTVSKIVNNDIHSLV